MASINEQISHLGNSPILCVLCILRGKIPFFPSKSVDFAAKAVYFVAAHAAGRLSRFTLSLRKLIRG